MKFNKTNCFQTKSLIERWMDGLNDCIQSVLMKGNATELGRYVCVLVGFICTCGLSN